MLNVYSHYGFLTIQIPERLDRHSSWWQRPCSFSLWFADARIPKPYTNYVIVLSDSVNVHNVLTE